MTLNICFLTFNIQKAKPLTSTNLFFFIAWGCVGWVISALFQPALYLGHRSTFNLSTCCTARWDEEQNLERRKSVADVNWLFAHAWKHHYTFAWQLFLIIFFFQLGSCIHYAKHYTNYLFHKYLVLVISVLTPHKSIKKAPRNYFKQRCAFEHETHLQ